jgi:hypothetical protein
MSVDSVARAWLRQCGAEAIEHPGGTLYGKQTWRELAATGVVVDRFTGQTGGLEPDQLRRMLDLSIVNELDVIEQGPAVEAAYGDYFRSLFAEWSAAATPSVDALRGTCCGSEAARAAAWDG